MARKSDRLRPTQKPELTLLDITFEGVVRVGKTCVTLDTMIAVFKQGATAEIESTSP